MFSRESPKGGLDIIITAIETQKRDSSRYSVFIDDQFAFGLSGVDLLFFKLKEGMELSLKEYECIVNETVFAKARDKAIRFLSYKARSKKEVYEKLLSSEDYPEEIIDRVINLMEKYGYIDDYKYTTLFIKEKVTLNGFGKLRLRYELKQKGIRDDYIEKALEEFNSDEYAIAQAMILKRYKGVIPEDVKERKKASGFLFRKGFSYEIINQVLNCEST